MGCFMACFGLSNKRKRRKTLYKVLAGNQKYGNYEALAITEKAMVPYSDLRDECKEQNNVKSKKKKKKVTFNLNVQIYEPDPIAYKVLDSEEEEHENNVAEPAKKNLNSPSVLGEGSASLTVTYPPDYRYYNCSENFDEEEDLDYEEFDIDDYDDDDEEFDDGYDCDDGGSDESLENNETEVYDENSRQKELSDSSNSSAAEDRIRNQMPADASGKDRSTNMHSVLSPVENLTQWKAIKAKVPSSKHRRKENIPSSEQKTSIPSATTEACSNFSPCCSMKSSVLQSKPLLPKVAVDASLSNWLISPNYSVSKTTIHCQ
ncbi:hypothetical protein PIB30_025694 [Stylosanthes scabra]|uniref:Uncharacterized protein n=1 Tax=Stylosanthes scabra TaxID=79078 RepID=A0ABU6XBY3_9FABA|nr:hypothetical protein [Stylosanthes scabra]